MDCTWIAFQKSLNRGVIHLMRAELPSLEPFAKSGDRIHLHGNRRGQETLVFNLF
jgi:hypothetical protein